MMVNEEKLDNILLELGHDDFNKGTAQLRQAVKMYEPGMMLTKELYPALGRAVGSTASRVERNMRHSIQKAWCRGAQETQARYFGGTVDPQRGNPTVGEYVARLHRLCRE
jgi:two-component system response regulator (stage 0 sporulation protein A)